MRRIPVFLMFSCAASYGVFTSLHVAMFLLYFNWVIWTEVSCLVVRIEDSDKDSFISAPVLHRGVHFCPTRAQNDVSVRSHLLDF